MWLLKFHISVCILCWIAMVSMKILFKERYKRYHKGKKKEKFGKQFFMYVCPVMNVIFVVALLWMALAPDSFVDEFNKTQDE